MGQGKDAENPNAPQSSPQQQQDKAPPATGSEGPTKTPKKRRKVNHGTCYMSCTPNTVNSLADS